MIRAPRLLGAKLLLALTLAAPCAAWAQRVDVDSAAQGEAITIQASADVQADPGTVWDVITDYEHLARFIPYMRSSRVVQRDAGRVIVEQTGELGFVFFRQSVEVRLAVVETAPRRVMARAIGGNIKEMEGLYAIERLPSGYTRLSYSGRVLPDFAMPPIIGRIALRSVMERQFAAMVGEIVSRERERTRAQQQ